MQPWLARALAVAVAAVMAGTGCAGSRQKQAERREHLLVVAGFRQIPADKPERVAALERLQPGRVTPVMHENRTFYVYPDTRSCNCLYVGRADEYDSYLKLLQQEKSPQPDPLPWNSGKYSNASEFLNPSVWGPWDWWE